LEIQLLCQGAKAKKIMKLFLMPSTCGRIVLLAAIQFGGPLLPMAVADEIASAGAPPWQRHYQEGEKIVYHMKATNRDRAGTWLYEFEADGIVKKDPEGKFYEEIGWTNLVSCKTTNKIDLFSLSNPTDWTALVTNKEKLVLSPSSRDFRQQLGLPPYFKVAIPDFSKISRAFLGPTMDLFSFYGDMQLASHFGGHPKAGDHFYRPYGTPPSWADGAHVIIGEDSFDFDCTIKEVDLTNQTATILVRHVPSEKPQVRLPAEWMRAPVSGVSNNWVQVEKNDNGSYTVGVGKESFDDLVKVSLADGRILSARMDNPVEVLERECADVNFTNAGEPIRYQIRRQIEVTGSP